MTPGTYKINVTAKDFFADTIVATGHSWAVVNDTPHFVVLSAQPPDTVIVLDTNGKFPGRVQISISMQASEPRPDLTIHVSVDGTALDSPISESGLRNYYEVTKRGTFKLVLTATDPAGNLLGADSVTRVFQ